VLSFSKTQLIWSDRYKQIRIAWPSVCTTSPHASPVAHTWFPVSGFWSLVCLQQPCRRSRWRGASVTRTRTAHRPRGKSRARPSAACRSASWRSASTGRSTWRRPSAPPWPRRWRWPTRRSRPGSRTDAPNGGKIETRRLLCVSIVRRAAREPARFDCVSLCVLLYNTYFIYFHLRKTHLAHFGARWIALGASGSVFTDSYLLIKPT